MWIRNQPLGAEELFGFSIQTTVAMDFYTKPTNSEASIVLHW